MPEAHSGLALIGRSASGEAQIQHLRGLHSNPERPPLLRIDAGFALGTLLDNGDRYNEAFASFSEANALQRRLLAASGEIFDRAALRQEIDSLISSCTPALYAEIDGSGNPSETPVFIVGMPRSRDIANIAGALQNYGRDRPADELDPDFARRLADRHVAHLRSLGRGRARIIDKMPDNIINAGLIAVLFPGARIIFCRRDLRDTCLSCYFSRFDFAPVWSHDLVDCGIRALETERLADHWRGALPLRMLTIDYETLVADLEGESRRLIGFLGLDWEPACLDFHKTDRPVLTGSAWQVRQPLFDRSVGRWRKYERYLGPLCEVLEAARVTA